MTLNDLHDFVVRTLPAAIGTALYAFTQLGLVAWLTCFWITIQIVRFSMDWYRQERDLYRKKIAKQAAEDKAEEGYP